MKYCKITAIIHVNSLEAVEEALKKARVAEVIVSYVKGYGDYKNFYSKDWTSAQARIELFAFHDDANRIVNVIMDATHTGLDTDGVIAVLPVENIYRIKDRTSFNYL